MNTPGEPPYAAPLELLPAGAPLPIPVVRGIGAVAGLVGAASVWCTATGAVGWGTACAVLFAVLALLAFGFGPTGGRKRPPQFINAVTLARAVVRPVDDWVHFYREHTHRVWDRAWILLSGWGTAALLAFALVRVLAAPGGAWWLFLYVPLLLVCIVIGGYALLQAVLDAKNSSFGRIPVGLTLGRQGISRYLVAGGVQHVPWTQVTAITALPNARIRIERGASSPLEFTAGVFDEHAPLIYCALRFYTEYPALRAELSTTVAQQRFEAWHRSE